jgi:hypothetical protein
MPLKVGANRVVVEQRIVDIDQKTMESGASGTS